MKPYIVVADGMDSDVFKKLQADTNFEVHPQSKVTQEELKELLPKINGLVIRSATKVNNELLAIASNLKYVIRAGEGTDNIDKAECQKRDIRVSNTPGANNNSAAEHAIALMMTALRRTADANKKLKEGGWNKSEFVGVELWKKKIGIVGFGRIGQIVAKRLSGFEPEILFYDPFLKESPFDYAKKANSLEEIFSSCDIITLHTPLMEATKGMVNRDLLFSMPSHSILINASRGGIVDEKALYELLSQNKIRSAAFDVFSEEPLAPQSQLRSLENIILTPHLGASTEEAQIRVGEMAAHQLEQFFINNNLLNEVRV